MKIGDITYSRKTKFKTQQVHIDKCGQVWYHKFMMKGFLKNFNRYKKKNLSLYDRFEKPEKKGEEWLNKFIELKESKGIVNFLQFAKEFYTTKLDFYSKDIMYLIANFTMNEESREVDINDYIEYIKRRHKLRLKDIGFDEDGKQLVFKPRFQKEFRATKFSEVSPEVTTISQNLENTERQENCHWFSIYMALSYVDTTVVTGDIYLFANKYRNLHSWVEQTMGDGTEICVDLTYNLLMRKKAYYSLLHIKPLERISREEIIKDMEIIAPLTNIDGNYTKLYLSSREEALAIAKEKEKSGEIVRLPPITERKIEEAKDTIKKEREENEKV